MLRIDTKERRPPSHRGKGAAFLVSALAVYALAFSPSSASAEGLWAKYEPPMPVERDAATMAFDAARGEIVLFGGNNSDAPQKRDDTWTWDGAQWQEKHPPTSPPARLISVMAFDAARGVVVLFGGFDPADPSGGYLGDTWTWNGITWTQQSPANSPPTRYGASMAFDAASGTVLLFGGYGNGAEGYLGDTWAWNGTTWTQMQTAAAPSPRLYSQMASDPARNTVVLFGGFNFVGGQFNDTWTWDAQNGTWMEQLPLTRPPGRSLAGFAPDRTGALLLFGGQTAALAGDLGDTWTWDGGNWTARTPSQSPAARKGLAMAYDETRERVVLFGGNRRDGLSLDYRDDTWLWDGSDWIDPGIAAPPSRRNEAGMDYDFARQEVVLFGGWNGQESLGDTWIWNGAEWRERRSATSPLERSLGAMAYDRARADTVLFGGFSNGARLGDTWTWNGAAWTLRTPVTSPAGRFGATMVYDAAREKVVLFGGSVLGGYQNDTWTWDGTNWTQQHPATAPPPRYRPGMAWHSASETVILFGGFDPAFDLLNDTWIWNGSTWTEKLAATPPSPRYSASLSDDPRDGTVVLFGGSTDTEESGETWTWDGDAWTQRMTSLAPFPSFSVGLAYDAARETIVLFGGANVVQGFLRDTWFWEGTAGPQPISAASRKAHSAVPFNIDLPLTGNPGIECRTGGPSGDHQVVINFPTNVSVGGAEVTSGTGDVRNFSVNGAEVTVNLTGITNGQSIVISLLDANDGVATGAVRLPMSVLLGDTTADRIVNSADITQTRRRSGQAAAPSNFRTDLSVDGVINSADVTLVRRASGSALR